MIEANELRKGVLIIEYTGIVREVYGEDIQQQCWHEEGQSGTTEAPLNPIPLTPEWLERCGFINGEIKPSYKLHMSVRPYQTATQGIFPGEWQVTLMDAVPHSLGQTIKYLHQLQNLYFALTGEELNVKL